MSVTPEASAARVCAGVDWAKDDHAVCVVGAEGEALVRFTIAHDAAGLKDMVRQLLKAGADEVGIERPDGPVVDALRGTVRARRDLVAHRVAVANQLRAHLQIVFPAAVLLFADIDSDISLRFLERFTSQTRADWLSVKRLTAWLAGVGYCGRTDPAVLHTRLAGAPRGADGAHADTHAATTQAYVAVLRAITAQIQTLAESISEQLTLHPDQQTFTSLPRSGTVRAARLLAEIGDARGRFPTPESLACLAGVAPATRQSGKTKSVGFRYGADKQLRDALCDFAGASRRANP